MLPPEILEFSVRSHLDEQANWELVLLKGHLHVDAILTDALTALNPDDWKKLEDWSLFRKLNELRRLSEDSERVRDAVSLALELNRMRNVLAHEAFPEELQADFVVWSKKVLSAFPSHKIRRHSSKSIATLAIAALARALHEIAKKEA